MTSNDFKVTSNEVKVNSNDVKVIKRRLEKNSCTKHCYWQKYIMYSAREVILHTLKVTTSPHSYLDSKVWCAWDSNLKMLVD